MWEIYSEYCKDFERQKAEEAVKAKGGAKKPAAGNAGRDFAWPARGMATRFQMMGDMKHVGALDLVTIG